MMRQYVGKQIRLLSPYIGSRDRVLDFGCGDLSLAAALKHRIPKLSITGVDVVDTGVRDRNVSFTTYDGEKLPFAKQTFDTTIVYHVFHHCKDPKASFYDVMRVTEKRILIVEPVYRTYLDLFFMKLLDRLGNGWRNVMIPMPFAFQKEETWETWIREAGWKIVKRQSAGILPGWLPFGETKLFVVVPR
jgi:ubiquinone/menaquinone biosynthesis C-methylase UbiE